MVDPLQSAMTNNEQTYFKPSKFLVLSKSIDSRSPKFNFWLIKCMEDDWKSSSFLNKAAANVASQEKRLKFGKINTKFYWN